MPQATDPRQLEPDEIAAAAAWWAERWEVPETREAFRVALVEQLGKPAPLSCCHLGGVVILGVDYDPNEALLPAVQAIAECRGFMFSAKGLLPMKTVMRIEPGRIVVREGRGADFVETWKRVE